VNVGDPSERVSYGLIGALAGLAAAPTVLATLDVPAGIRVAAAVVAGVMWLVGFYLILLRLFDHLGVAEWLRRGVRWPALAMGRARKWLRERTIERYRDRRYGRRVFFAINLGEYWKTSCPYCHETNKTKDGEPWTCANCAAKYDPTTNRVKKGTISSRREDEELASSLKGVAKD
jgi:hypothetical protein